MGHPNIYPNESDVVSPNVVPVSSKEPESSKENSKESSKEEKRVYVVYLNVYINEQSFTVTKFVKADNITKARAKARVILTVNNYHDWVLNTFCKWELYDVTRLDEVDTVDMDYYQTQYNDILEKDDVTLENINNTY